MHEGGSLKIDSTPESDARNTFYKVDDRIA